MLLKISNLAGVIQMSAKLLNLFLVAFFSFWVALLIQLPSSSQVCYMQTQDGVFVDLSNLCTPREAFTSSETFTVSETLPISGMSDEELAEFTSVERVFDEVYELCSNSNRCNTQEQYFNELTNFCESTRSCPTSLVEQIRAGNRLGVSVLLNQ